MWWKLSAVLNTDNYLSSVINAFTLITTKREKKILLENFFDTWEINPPTKKSPSFWIRCPLNDRPQYIWTFMTHELSHTFPICEVKEHTHKNTPVPPTPPLTWKHPAELNTLQPFRCLTRKLTEMDKSLFQSHICVGIPDKCSPDTGHGAECKSSTYSFIQFWPTASSCWPTAGLKVRSPLSLSLSEGAKCDSSSLLSQQNNILFLCLTLLSFRFQPQ